MHLDFQGQIAFGIPIGCEPIWKIAFFHPFPPPLWPKLKARMMLQSRPLLHQQACCETNSSHCVHTPQVEALNKQGELFRE